MYCKELHSEFKKDGNIECAFCNRKLEETKRIEPKCCDRPNLISDSHIVCTSCGAAVNDFDLAKDFGGTASKAEKKICKSKNCV